MKFQHSICRPRLLRLIAAAFLFATVPVATPAQSTASAAMKLIAFSPQVDAAIGEGPFGLDQEMQFTTLEGEINGEFELASEGVPYDLSSIMVLEDPLLFENYFLPCVLDLPALADVNNNGVDDFFDIEIAVSQVPVAGAYISPVSGEAEPFDAIWSRAAGNLQGTLSISIGDLGLNTVHQFRLYQYEGQFVYTPGAAMLSGEVTLTNWWDPTDALTGALALSVLDPNTLTAEAGSFAGTSPFPYTFNFDPLDNFDLLLGGQYLSYLGIDDGYLYTGGADYNEWMAFIDGSDSDGDGIPDLVETDEVPIIPPSLAAIRVAEGIQITITGTAGTSYSLETAGAVTGDWSELQMVSLEAETLVLTLPIDGSRQLLRLKLDL